MNDAAQKYSKPSIILHAITGLLIIIMFAIGWYMTDLPKDAPKTTTIDAFGLGIHTLQFKEPIAPRSFYFNLHKSIGFCLLILLLLRVYVRLTSKLPAFPNSMKLWEVRLAEFTHRALYVVFIAMPVAGVVMAIYSKYGLTVFGLPLVHGLDNSGIREFFKETHETLGWVLVTLIGIHLLATLKHQFIDKDNILSRMSPH